MVDKSGPEKLEDLLGDLQDEYGSVETLPEDVENLLQELRSGQDFLSRHHAAAALGRIGTGYPKVRSALQAAGESDPHAAVRRAAAQALRAWEEQERSREQAAQAQADEDAVQEQGEETSIDLDVIRAGGSGPGPAVSGPHAEPGQAHSADQTVGQPRMAIASRRTQRFFGVKVATQEDTIQVSWRPAAINRLAAVALALLGIAPFVVALAAAHSGLYVGLSCILAGPSIYFLVAVLLSVTRVTATPDEWAFSRGVLPLPVPTYYIRAISLDPSACGRVWLHRSAEAREPRYRSRRRRGDWPVYFLEGLVKLALHHPETWQGPEVITHSLNARCMDGTEKTLLWPVSGRRGAYLETLLTRLLREQVVNPAAE